MLPQFLSVSLHLTPRHCSALLTHTSVTFNPADWPAMDKPPPTGTFHVLVQCLGVTDFRSLCRLSSGPSMDAGIERSQHS